MLKFLKKNLGLLFIFMILTSCVTSNVKSDLYKLKIQIIPKEAGIVDPSGGEFKGRVEVNAIANDGWVFNYWETSSQIKANPHSLYLNKDLTAKAVFAPTFNLDLKVVPKEAGSLNQKSGLNGGTVLLRAVPTPGWVFDHWEGLEEQKNENPVNFEITQDTKINAVFVKSLYSIDLTSDLHWYKAKNPEDLNLICENINKIGPGSIMVSSGDIDGPVNVSKVLQENFGNDYLWYPSIGNHDPERTETMEWFRNHNSIDAKLKNVVNRGPPGAEETMYSLDYKDLHIIILNEYYDGETDAGAFVQIKKKNKLKMKDVASIHDGIYNWLKKDLEKNKKPYILVVGHEPAFPVRDMHNGRLRHKGDSLDQFPALRDRFWSLLKQHQVMAYVCGHTHTYSVVDFEGVWQINLASARGPGYTKAKSSFSKLYYLGDGDFRLNTYRIDKKLNTYSLEHSEILE